MFPLALRRLVLLLAVSVCFPCRAAESSTLATQLVQIREEVYLMPRTSLRRLEELKKATHRSVRESGHMLDLTSKAYHRLNNTRDGLRAALQLEQLGREHRDDLLLAMGLLDHAYFLSGSVYDAPAARELFRQASEVAATTTDAYVRTQTLVSLAAVTAEEGEPAAALVLLKRAVQFARRSNDADALFMALKLQAETLADLANYDEALEATDEMVALASQRGVPLQTARAHLAEYEIAMRAGRAQRAVSALQQAVDILRALKASEGLPGNLVKLAALKIRLGHYREAEALSESAQALSTFSDTNDDRMLSVFGLGLSRIYLGELGNGSRLSEQALSKLKNSDRYVQLLLDYAQALSARGDVDSALKTYALAGQSALAEARKEKQLSYQVVKKTLLEQKKNNEIALLGRERALKAAELDSERTLKIMWWAISIIATAGCMVIGILYRKVRASNRYLRSTNASLYSQSTSDSLTGLRNRNYFYQHVVAPKPPYSARHGLANTAVHPDGLAGAFFLMDVDRFKAINDDYGHAVGDEVLRTVARRLAETVRDDDVLIRWGGEEFLAFMPAITPFEASEIAERLLSAVCSSPIIVGDTTINASISMGYSVSPITSDDRVLPWEQLVHLCDLALYLSKAQGRNRAYGISGPLELSRDALLAAEADLRQAFADGHIVLCEVASHKGSARPSIPSPMTA